MSVQEFMDMAVGFDSEDILDFSDRIGYWTTSIGGLPPWWSRGRDSVLRDFWKDGQQGGAIMSLAQTKLSAIPLRVSARDTTITAHVSQARLLEVGIASKSEFGLGLYQAMLKFSEDYLGQDNGAFMEVMGRGDPSGAIEGMPVAVRHLDSAKCTRTGNPEYPVVYIGEDGEKYKLHFSRVIYMSQMPSAKRSMNGVGYSSVSRSIRILQNLHHVVNYKDEKMGARAASQILIGTGITGREIVKAIAASEAIMDNLQLKNFARTIALGSEGGEVDLKRVDLNKFDPFDEKTTLTFAGYTLAMAWGLEFSEIMPVNSTRVGDNISLQRARAKLPNAFTAAFEQQANIKLVPPYLKISLDYQDDQADQQHAIIEDITSRNFARQMESGVTTPGVVQQLLWERGYIKREHLWRMQLGRHELSGGVPVSSLFFNPRYEQMLLVPREFLLTTAFDYNNVKMTIEANEMAIYRILGSTKNSQATSMAIESLSALDWLRKKYENEELRQSGGAIEEFEQEVEGLDRPLDGRLTNRESGEKGHEPSITDFFLRNNLQATDIIDLPETTKTD